MKALAALPLVLALTALPRIAEACHQLSESVWMCAGTSAWAAAEWDPYGDGASLLLDDYTLSFTEDWPGAEIRDGLTTLEEQFVTYAELAKADGNAPLEVKAQEAFDIPSGRAFRSLQRDHYNDVETVSAVMLAEVDVVRIMLWLDAPRNTGWDKVDTESLEILGLLRNVCADPDTCDGPNQASVKAD